MCNCIENINMSLVFKGSLLDTAIIKGLKSPVVQIAIRPRHHDEDSTAHKPRAWYCPFCGEKYK